MLRLQYHLNDCCQGFLFFFKQIGLSFVAFFLIFVSCSQSSPAATQVTQPVLTFLKQNGLHFENVEEHEEGVIAIKNAYLPLGHNTKVNIETLLIKPKENGRFDFEISNINYKDGFEFNLDSLSISDLKFEHKPTLSNKRFYLPSFLNSLLNMDINQIDFSKMSLRSSIGNTSYLLKFTIDAGAFESVSQGIVQSQYFWGSAIEVGKKSVGGDNQSINLSIDHINFRDLNCWQVFDLIFAPRNYQVNVAKSIAKSVNIRHINYYDNSQTIDFEEVNLSGLLLRQNRETFADLFNNQISVLAMSDVERGKDGQPLVEDPLADYKDIKLLRSYFYLLDMVQTVDLDFEDYAKEYEDGAMEYQFLIKTGTISYQNNKLTFQFNQLDDVSRELENPSSIRLFNLPLEWKVDEVQAKNIDLANFYNFIDGEFSRLLDKDGLKKNANFDYSKVLMQKIWPNFPQIDSLSVHNLNLYAPSKHSNNSNAALEQVFKLNELSLRNEYETPGPIPTKIAFVIDDFVLPKKIIAQMNMPRFKSSSLNVNLNFQAAWNSNSNSLKIDNSFIESKQLGRLAIGAEFSNVQEPIFSGQQGDMLGNLINVMVNKLVLQYEDRGLKDQNFSFIAGLSFSSLDELKTKIVEIFEQRLNGLQLEDSKVESFVRAYDAYIQNGSGLVLTLEEKTPNSVIIAVLIPAFMENKTLLWSLMDIDLASIP
ncbi:hypothetical protein N5853_10065 [Bartonella sp. HY329]|uniref:hypothetical protein n=1 Tax=unclassified Bartonella TaxID=2645622 RepID=UPI0021C9450E|nr:MULTISPECIES: hypothetical protein [unclassified Bartonella]UXM94446.1 hypothetical protein N5853_10065 [Bartonella sp. HY329]UXN08770.1 hypothetical protein N5852_10075 [Bartonella sp. HY328]